MKRTLLLIIGYWLVIQAGIGALGLLTMQGDAVILLTLSTFFGFGGYWLIQKAKRLQANQPTKELEPPETAKMDITTTLNGGHHIVKKLSVSETNRLDKPR